MIACSAGGDFASMLACPVCLYVICQLLSCRYGHFALTPKGCNISDNQVVTIAQNLVVQVIHASTPVKHAYVA